MVSVRVGQTIDDLVANYPKLYHMATAGSWPLIQRHGLLTTTHLVQTSGLPGDEQDALLQQRRLHSTQLNHPTIGPVSIRDQAPLREPFFSAVLTDMTQQQWLDVL